MIKNSAKYKADNGPFGAWFDYLPYRGGFGSTTVAG